MKCLRAVVVSVLVCGSAWAESLDWTSWNLTSAPTQIDVAATDAFIVASDLFWTQGSAATTVRRTSGFLKRYRLGPRVADRQFFLASGGGMDAPCFMSPDGTQTCLGVPSITAPGTTFAATGFPQAAFALVAWAGGVGAFYTSEYPSNGPLTGRLGQVLWFDPSSTVGQTVQIVVGTPPTVSLISHDSTSLLWQVDGVLHSWDGGSVTVRDAGWNNTFTFANATDGLSLATGPSELWSFDAQHDTLLTDDCSPQRSVAALGGRLLACTQRDGGAALVRTDGTTAGTTRVWTLPFGYGRSTQFFVTDSAVFVSTWGADQLVARTDGRSASVLGFLSSSSTVLGARGDALYFARDVGADSELVRWDADGGQTSLGVFATRFSALQTQTGTGLLGGALAVGAVPQGVLFIADLAADASVDAGAGSDAGSFDAGPVASIDAGVDAGAHLVVDAGGPMSTVDAGSDAVDGGLDTPPVGGCGCTESSALFPFALLAWLALRRR